MRIRLEFGTDFLFVGLFTYDHPLDPQGYTWKSESWLCIIPCIAIRFTWVNFIH